MADQSSNNAVSCTNVSYNIKHTIILKDISLSIKQGTITGILGPNGAGKSTLLSLFIGLRNPTAGTVLLFEQQRPHDAKTRQHIGVVLQETALYDDLTTYENLRFAASLYHIDD